MNELNFYYPYYTDDMLGLVTQPTKPNDKLPVLNAEIAELQDVLFPIDPTTGLYENPVSKLLGGNLSVLERDKILSQLQVMPASKRNNLSDEELINLLPSRYNSTLTDMDAVRDFFESTIVSDVDQGEQVEQVEQGEQGEQGGQSE